MEASAKSLTRGISPSDVDVQRERIAALKKEREFLLEELRARSANANELRNRMKEKEISKTMEVKQRMNGTNLAVNLHNTYGPTALDRAVDFYNPPTGHTGHYKEKSSLMADLMEQRRLEHKSKTGQYQEAISILNNHRRSILAEQNRIYEDKRRLVGGRYSPSINSIPGDHDVYKYPRPEYPPETPSEPSRSPYYAYPEEAEAETMESLVEKVKTLIPKMEKTVTELKLDLDMEDLKFVKMGEQGRGLDSFEPYQRDAAIICRSIVNELVEKSMDSFLRQQLPAKHRKHYEEEAMEVSRELNKFHKTTLKQKVGALIRDELVLEVTAELTVDAIDEFFEISKMSTAKSNNLVIKAAEVSASAEQEERLPDDPDYLRINKIFEKLLRERSEKKTKAETSEQIWKHSLPMTHISGKPVVEIREDVDPIDVHQIKPFDLREKNYESPIYNNFWKKEARYWEGIDVEISRILLTAEMKGCQTAKLSSKHRLLAVGTGHGDILVYDLFQPEARLLYVARSPSRGDYPIESIAWSGDDSQIICQRDRAITVYNILISLEVNERELSDLGIKFTKTDEFKPFSLYEVIMLNQSTSDFQFARGPIAEQNGEVVNQSLGMCKFHPSSTLACSSFSVMVSFEKGDMQKLDFENEFLGQDEDLDQKKMKIIYPQVAADHGTNFIAKGIQSELFKAHNSQIILIAFISGVGEMVTLDDLGYLNWWRYTKDYFTQDFCEPYKKNKLIMQKVVYVPVNSQDNPPKVIFSRYNTDSRGRKIPLASDELEKRMDTVETELFMKSIEDKELVWQDNDDPDLLTKQYPADLISKSGSTFYTITRAKLDKELHRVEKELLRPKNVKATRLLEAETTPDGDIIIYMTLFNRIEQVGPHISFFAFDLERKESLDLRLDIPITERDYDIILTNNVVSFETSRPFDTTSTAYIIVNVMGSLSGYSLTTGTKIMTATSDEFNGLNLLSFTGLPRSVITLQPSAGIIVASPPKTDRIQIISYSPDQSMIDILSLRDLNTKQTRKDMWLAYRTLEMMQPERVLQYDPDQRIRKSNWLLDGEEYIGALTATKAIVFDIIDDAVDKAYFEKASDLEPEPQFDQSGQQIVDEDGNPVLKVPKRGYPEDYKEQKDARMAKNRQLAISNYGIVNAYGDLKLFGDLEEVDKAYERAVAKYGKKNKPRIPTNRIQAVDAFDDATANQQPSEQSENAGATAENSRENQQEAPIANEARGQETPPPPPPPPA